MPRFQFGHPVCWYVYYHTELTITISAVKYPTGGFKIKGKSRLEKTLVLVTRCFGPFRVIVPTRTNVLVTILPTEISETVFVENKLTCVLILLMMSLLSKIWSRTRPGID